jgi:hypothetical protein
MSLTEQVIKELADKYVERMYPKFNLPYWNESKDDFILRLAMHELRYDNKYDDDILHKLLPIDKIKELSDEFVDRVSPKYYVRSWNETEYDFDLRLATYELASRILD